MQGLAASREVCDITPRTEKRTNSILAVTVTNLFLARIILTIRVINELYNVPSILTQHYVMMTLLKNAIFARKPCLDSDITLTNSNI